MVEIISVDDLTGEPHANVFPTEEPKTIRLRLSAGETVAPHQHPDRYIILYLISGELALQLGEDIHDIQAGEIVHFDGALDVFPTANTDCTALLILAQKQ